MKNIIIIGMPGCGKTTIGKLVAERLGMEFTDSDHIFEKNVCSDITEYFSKYGENGFRKEETRILAELTKKTGCVISTGGGVVERAENKDILKNGGTVVFIDRSPEDIVCDVDTESRPLLLADGKERIFTLYDKRYEKYKDFCHLRIENKGTLQEVTEKIINEVNNYNG